MNLKDKIKSIKKDDKVLDVGPGSEPHPRADILLEKIYNNKDELMAQSGSEKTLITDKKIIKYNGGAFPFADKEFDYVICSHVLEHVDDVDFFLYELSRVAYRGYIEYPTVYYEYLYNFKVHKNLLKMRDNTILWQKKEKFNFSNFSAVNDFFYATLCNFETALIERHKNIFFEGFEWFGKISGRQTNKIEDFIINTSEYGIKSNSIKRTLRRVFNKIQKFL